MLAVLFALNFFALSRDTVPAPLAALVPGYAALGRLADQALWARAVGSLLAAGEPVPQALEAAAVTVQSPTLQSELSGLLARVRRGSGFAQALSESWGFDPYLVWATATGEEGEELAPLLLHAADTLEEQLQSQARYRVQLAEPWAVLLLGLLVAASCAAFWWPFYQATNAIS
ncbi:MAG: type II secretion system F family protein [Armatimonadetes bacterium]|nr:type II secretion system F family protein [Armatimonadota bacterium]